MKTADSQLRSIMEIEGVLATLVLSVDGSVVEALNLDLDEVETFSSLVSMVTSTCMALGSEKQLGDLEQFMIEYSGGKIYLRRNEYYLLAVFADRQAVSGMIRMAMSHIPQFS